MQKHFDAESENFSRITIGLSSPESIIERSNGEVTKPETINYRSYKPEKDGLFSEKIFGPTKDWECYCGKYRGIRFKGIICDRCSVEITKKDVRRKRMGHIELAVPIVHIWFFKSLPSKVGSLLGVTNKELEKIIYYEAHAVVQPGKSGLDKHTVLTDQQYYAILNEIPPNNSALPDSDPNKFIALMGGQAVLEMLKRLNIPEMSRNFRAQLELENSVQRKADIIKRLRITEAFMKNDGLEMNKPQWMVLKSLPVVPPDLRPLVPLDGGRFATSDLNDLYRRVIIRNNRLRRLLDIKAPDIILRNEKRMLQEAVDSLFDNGRKSVALRSDGNRPLKSLSDNLRGKQGRFRQNLLGKRVDYSGRSVIVVGPNLKLHECGLPKDMAVELFKPFIIRKLIERDYTKTVKSAKKMVERKIDVVYELLEEIIADHPVLLNRAPTLHRLGIQAFQPVLVEGKAIRLHPLVCAAFNADFDGDQMAVHVPLSFEAQIEARLLMLSPRNILHPANGRPIAIPSQDMVLGCYYLTKVHQNGKGAGKKFLDAKEVIVAYSNDVISLHAPISVKIMDEYVTTTAGRILFNDIIPAEVSRYRYYNELLSRGRLQEIVSDVFQELDFDGTARFLDQLKMLGFSHATRGGLSISLSDIEVPQEKHDIIDTAFGKVHSIQGDYEAGMITDGERYNMVMDTWTHATNAVSETMFGYLKNSQEGFNPLFMMADSGARGSKDQIRQLAGMRGLMAKPQKSLTGQKGEIIEAPIIANFKEGLSVLEYFISTHGARKGLADTALKTADAGYLTRRLVDVAQDVIISIDDCNSDRGLTIEAIKEGEEVSDQLYDRIIGRVTAEPLYDAVTGEEVMPINTLIGKEEAHLIAKSGISKVKIRSVLTCVADTGVCRRCYGINLTTLRIVDIGEAVGVIAAQAIGEPGTQLTLRTFHVGGTASLIATESQIKAKSAGRVEFQNMEYVERPDGSRITLRRNGILKLIDENNRVVSRYSIPYAAKLMVVDKMEVSADTILFSWDPYNSTILANTNGKVQFSDIKEGVSLIDTLDDATGQRTKVIIETKSKDKKLNPSINLYDGKQMTGQYILPVGALLLVQEGDEVIAGDQLVKIPRDSAKTKDITGGLPRVTELFEARKPKDPAVVTDIDGIVKFGALKRGYREISVIPSEVERKKDYQVPIGRHILVHDGEAVTAGERLTEGSIVPQDILEILGPHKVQEYLVNEIQDVYKGQGVKINDKHIEIIVRQMMQKVKILESGDTMYLEGDLADNQKVLNLIRNYATSVIVTDPGDSRWDIGKRLERTEFQKEVRRLEKANKKAPVARQARPAQYQQILLGITQASLATESFISAASFQETTRVLTESAIERKSDTLKGLKENVIMGHLIPAGTGVKKFRSLVVEAPEGEEDDLRIIAASSQLSEQVKMAAMADRAVLPPRQKFYDDEYESDIEEDIEPIEIEDIDIEDLDTNAPIIDDEVNEDDEDDDVNPSDKDDWDDESHEDFIDSQF